MSKNSHHFWKIDKNKIDSFVYDEKYKKLSSNSKDWSQLSNSNKQFVFIAINYIDKKGKEITEN